MRFHLFTALLLLCTACASIDEEGEKTRPHKMLHTARGHIHLIAAPEAGGGVRADQPGATDREIGRMESEIGRMESEIRRMESEIRRMEYSYRPFNEDGEVIWSAPNRALGMRTRVTAAGIEIFPRATPAQGDDAPWKLELGAVASGGGAALDCANTADLAADGNRVELERAAIKEWIVNSESGVEYGLRITAPPGSGSREPLRVVVGRAAGGRWKTGIDSVSLFFEPAEGGGGLRYALERAEDGEGRPAEASLEIDDEGRAVVILHDPGDGDLFTIRTEVEPTHTMKSYQTGQELGFALATAGDVNNDGYSDSLVGAPAFDGGHVDEGRVFLIYGSALGPVIGFPVGSWERAGGAPQARFGHSLTTAGDVTGDGFDDFLVGAPGLGKVYLFEGSKNGPGSGPDWQVGGDPDSGIGTAVGFAGDVNGDGFHDVLVSADAIADPQGGGSPAEGVLLFLGSLKGLGTNADLLLRGDQAKSGFGDAVAPAGDVNGDGFDDVLVGAPHHGNGQKDEGMAYLFQGQEGGIAGQAVWKKESDETGSFFGRSLYTAGDVNGDGFADVVVGAYGWDGGLDDRGRVEVYHGSEAFLPQEPAWFLEGDRKDAWLGYAVSTAGDANGDGYADVIVGAPHYSDQYQHQGLVSVYLGSPQGVSGELWDQHFGKAADVRCGLSVACAGDYNGDGFGDMFYRQPGHYTTSGSVCLVVFWSGFPAKPEKIPGFSAFGTQNTARFGQALAPAGDVNGDGFSDLLVGAPDFDTGIPGAGRVFAFYGSAGALLGDPDWWADGLSEKECCGFSVAGAGDVNGDGFDDVVVGAPGPDDSSDKQGFVYLFLGERGGLSAERTRYMGDHPGDRFGHCLSSAGDVNGDGYGDVIVGAPHYSHAATEEGLAALFLGSSKGLFRQWAGTSGKHRHWFGFSVSCAGDVNRDGLSDVAVGAPTGHGDLPGRVYVFRGTDVVQPGIPPGLEGTPGWTFEGEQPGDLYGWSLSRGFDGDGDGYYDLAVGAPGYDLFDKYLIEDAGLCFIHRGSSKGLNPSFSGYAYAIADARTGHTVAAVGDVDGDGMDEFGYGAPGVGLCRVENLWVFSWETAHPQIPEYGFAIAGAGDMNGDGFDDFVIGFPLAQDGGAAVGAVYLHRGNDDGGRARHPSWRRHRGGIPVTHLGHVDASGGFRVGLRGMSPAGRVEVALAWQISPMKFSSSRLGVEPIDSGAPQGPEGSFVPLETGIDELKAGTLYAYRFRVVTPNPLFPTTPWTWQRIWGLNDDKLRAEP